MSVKRYLTGPCIVLALVMASIGACSQHDPGSWEGGGRSYTGSQLSGSVTPEDAGSDDVFTLPDVSLDINLPDIKVD